MLKPYEAIFPCTKNRNFSRSCTTRSHILYYGCFLWLNGLYNFTAILWFLFSLQSIHSFYTTLDLITYDGILTTARHNTSLVNSSTSGLNMQYGESYIVLVFL